MSTRILLEDSFGTFKPERDQNGAIRASVMESTVVEGRTFTRIPGRFSMVGEVNGNGRRYGQEVWEMNLKEGSALQESIKECSAFGLLEHPSDGHIDLRSPIAILVSKAQLQESGEVTGEITVLNTAEGQRLLALIEAGWDPRVSSRGFGSLIKGSDGVDEVQKDFVCEGWDVVLKPSFKSAIMTPDRAGKDDITRTESKKPSFDYEKSLTEGKPAPAASTPTFAERVSTIKTREDAKHVMNEGLATLESRDSDVEKAILESSVDDELKSAMAYHYAKAVVKGPWQEAKSIISKSPKFATMHEALGKPSPEPAAPAAPANKPIQESEPQNNMNTIESVKQRIASLKRAANGESLSPADFASAMHEAQSLHNDVAGFLAEDSKQSWTATQMHAEIQEAEKALESKILEGVQLSEKLSTDKHKLLKVIEAVTKETVSLKKKLGEQIAKTDAKNKVIEEVAKRGKFWKARAERMESRANVLEGRLDMAYRVSDYVSERYKADTTRISAGHLLNEFAEELTKDEHAENKTVLESVANGEAPESITCLKDLMPIRESLAPAEPTKNKPLSESAKPKKPAAKPVSEGETPTEPEGSAGTLQEGEKQTKVRILDSKQRNPVDVSESASIARRLSESIN